MRQLAAGWGVAEVTRPAADDLFALNVFFWLRRSAAWDNELIGEISSAPLVGCCGGSELKTKNEEFHSAVTSSHVGTMTPCVLKYGSVART